MQRPIADRLPLIDGLRGFALFGVFAANLLIFSGYTYMTEAGRAAVSATPLDRTVYLAEQFLIENKFIGLFSVLFGISFWLFLSRPRARAGPTVGLFYRRIGWLFLIGALHGWLLWCFDILRFYALWALLLPLCLRMPLRRLLVLALSAAVLIPAAISGLRSLLGLHDPKGADYDAMALAAFSTGDYARVLAANWKYDWYLTASVGQAAYQLAVFGRLLLGLYAARAFDLADPGRHREQLWKVAGVGAVVGVAGNIVFAGELMTGADGFVVPFARRFLVESGFLGLTVAYAAALALLYLKARGKETVERLAPLGRMALTAYLLQTLFGIWLFYGFAPGPHLMGKVGPAGLALICVAGYAVQVALARSWMRRFRFGPAEWAWRTLTYGRVQPMRRVADGDAS